MARIALNGFGRIGRLFFRQAFGAPGFEIVAINDLGELENLAYLLRHDTVYRGYGRSVSVDTARGALVVDGVATPFFREKDPTALPWAKLGVDIVVEATGAFESYAAAKAHLAAGARRVVLTAPAKDEDGAGGRTVLVGVNEGELDSATLTSNGSCTTNAASPLIAVLSENPGILKAVLNTVHAYTATQGIVDGPVRGSDFRRGRAGAVNIVPSTTGAASAVARALPTLAGKFDGVAMRVPVVAGSLADITFLASRRTSVSEVNDVLRAAARSPRWRGILAVSEDQLVSSDIIGEPYAAIADLSFTRVVDGDLVKVFSWYDNEWGYVSTLLRHVERVVALL